jgi:hypothetical protein
VDPPEDDRRCVAGRRTFVVRVRDVEGPAVVQDIRTGERAQVAALGGVVAVIDRWLRRDGAGPPIPPSP